LSYSFINFSLSSGFLSSIYFSINSTFFSKKSNIFYRLKT
jgi:hypothetical protein